MSKPLWGPAGCFVPHTVAVCPECGSELIAQAFQWDAKTRRPIASGIEVDCLKDLADAYAERATHKFHQDKWQPVRDAISKWCKARFHEK